MLKLLARKKELENPEITQLRQEIRNCEFLINRNRTIFNMVADEDLIESQIYEREALRCQYNYLIKLLKEKEVLYSTQKCRTGEG